VRKVGIHRQSDRNLVVSTFTQTSPDRAAPPNVRLRATAWLASACRRSQWRRSRPATDGTVRRSLPGIVFYCDVFRRAIDHWEHAAGVYVKCVQLPKYYVLCSSVDRYVLRYYASVYRVLERCIVAEQHESSSLRDNAPIAQFALYYDYSTEILRIDSRIKIGLFLANHVQKLPDGSRQVELRARQSKIKVVPALLAQSRQVRQATRCVAVEVLYAGLANPENCDLPRLVRVFCACEV